MNADARAGDFRPGTVTMSGTITATLTWVPDPALFTDPAPDKVMVDERASASWQSTANLPTATSGSRSVSLGGEVLFDNASGDGGGIGKRHLHEVGAGGTITLTCSLQATASNNGEAFFGNPVPNMYDTTLMVRGDYTVSIHAHPYNFRLAPDLPSPDENPHNDGGGVFDFQYVWGSTDGNMSNLSRILVDEFVSYPGNGPTYLYPCPPFVGWESRNPTEGHTADPPRTKSGDLGFTYDYHYLGGGFQVPDAPSTTEIPASQYYQFHCPDCMQPGEWKPIEGPNSGPHSIVWRFAPISLPGFEEGDPTMDCWYDVGIWRYSVTKHGRTAWLNMTRYGLLGSGMF